MWAAVDSAKLPDFETAGIEVVELEDDLHVLMGPGGNIAVHWDGDVMVVVDAGVAARGAELVARMRALSDAPRRVLINTHWHYDHTGGNPAFDAAGYTVVATANARQRMTVPQRLDVLDASYPPSSVPGLAVLTFADVVELRVAGGTVRAEAARPAHTDGDAIVTFGRHDVIHCGDIFFNGAFPIVDTLTGGTIEGMIAALHDIAGRCTPRTRVIPGHGGMATRHDVAAAAGMMSTVRDRLRPPAERGEPLEAVVANDPLADLNDPWGRWIIRSTMVIRMVYPSMLAQK